MEIADKIRENLNDPESLEKLYREDQKSFASGFDSIYTDINNAELARYWKIRLVYDKAQSKANKFPGLDVLVLIVTCLLTGFLMEIPSFFRFGAKDVLFYERNTSIIVFLGLTAYSIWINRTFDKKKLVFIALAFMIPLTYINLLPSKIDHDSINLAYAHLPFLMWYIYGLAFIKFDTTDKSQRIDYVKYNGDVAVLGALILIAGAIMSAITISLFMAIGVNIGEFYFKYIIILGLASTPIVATYIIQNYPSLTNKIAPIIAKIFSPLVLITLVIYLMTIPFSGKNPYRDRDLLMIFNVMLLGVMALIVYAVSETSIQKKQKFNEVILFTLSLVTLIVDVITLSAISYRLFEHGITPNRLAVVGSNLLIFGNLLLIMIDLFKVNTKRAELDKVQLTMAKYLPVYMIWSLFVVFGFPFIFGMR